MKDGLRVLGLLLFIFAMIGYAVWWELYRYGECRKVGHENLYCILAGGGK